jgi:hypothetical protein
LGCGFVEDQAIPPVTSLVTEETARPPDSGVTTRPMRPAPPATVPSTPAPTTVVVPEPPPSLAPAELEALEVVAAESTGYFPDLVVVVPGTDLCLAAEQMFKGGSNLFGGSSFAPPDATADLQRYRNSLDYAAPLVALRFGGADSASLLGLSGYLSTVETNQRAALVEQVMRYQESAAASLDRLLNKLIDECASLRWVPRSPTRLILDNRPA